MLAILHVCLKLQFHVVSAVSIKFHHFPVLRTFSVAMGLQGKLQADSCRIACIRLVNELALIRLIVVPSAFFARISCTLL